MTASPALSGVSIDRHSMTELMDVERLTPALSSDWLEQQGVMPLRLVDGRLEVGTWLDTPDPLALDDLRL